MLASPLWLVLVAPLAVAVALGERRLGGTRRRWLLRTVVRSLLLGVALLALAAPQQRTQLWPPPRAAVVVDGHALQDADALGDALVLLGALREQAQAQGVDLRLCAWDTGAGSGPLPGDLELRQVLEGLRQGAAATSPPAVALGLAAGRLALGSGAGGGVLLVGDGRESLENAGPAAQSARDRGLSLRAEPVPLSGKEPAATARITHLSVPTQARGPFDVRVAFENLGSGDFLALFINGEEQRVFTPNPPQGEALFGSLELGPGAQEITVRVLSATPDPTSASGEARAIVEVMAPPRIGALLADPQRSATRRALSAQGLRVEAISADGLALALTDAGRLPDALAADAASLAALEWPLAEALADRVRAGLGLLVEAGDDAQAWAHLAESPLAALLPLEPQPPPAPPPPPVQPPTPPEPARPLTPPEPAPGPGLRAERRPEDALPITLLLLVDRSPSMGEGNGAKLRMAVEGARRAALALSPKDRVGVITFADDVTLDIAPTTAGLAVSLVTNFLSGVEPNGRGTNLFGALQMAGRVMAQETSPVLHVLLLTDGRQFPEGPIFSPVVRPMAQRGVTITGVGIGRQAHLAQLRDIVQWAAGGMVISAADPSELPTIMTRDTRRVADRRDEEAQMLARLRDPETPPEDPEEQPEPQPPQRPDPETPPDPTPEPKAPERLKLRVLRPHEATRGLDDKELPRVGPPRAARLRPAAALLLAREDDLPVLAAARAGLGRVLVWALPSGDSGAENWPEFPSLLGQAARSVIAPQGAFAFLPQPRVVQGAGQAILRADWPLGGEQGSLQVRWEVGSELQELGQLPADRAAGLLLPSLAAGTRARLHLVTDGGRVLPPLTYIAAPAPPAARPAGDVRAINLALGAFAPDAASWLRSLQPQLHETRQPVWLPLLLLALLLFLLDAALHRQGAQG